MEMTNHLITAPATAGSSSCHSASQRPGSWVSRWSGLVFGGGVMVASITLALSQHWLTVAELTPFLFPLLFLLPCMLMMLMCMKGHGQQAGGTQDSAGTTSPINTDATNR
jgi:hypothetical protein